MHDCVKRPHLAESRFSYNHLKDNMHTIAVFHFVTNDSQSLHLSAMVLQPSHSPDGLVLTIGNLSPLRRINAFLEVPVFTYHRFSAGHASGGRERRSW